MPTLITSTARTIDGFSTFHGPFESGNKLYVLLYDYVADTVEAWVSSDAGSTWAEADPANHIACYSTGGSDDARQFSAFREGDVLWVACRYLGGGGPLGITSFNISTGLWAGFSAVGGPTPDTSGNTPTDVFGARVKWYLIRLSTGAFRLVLQNIHSVSSIYYTHIDVYTYSGGSWSAATRVWGPDGTAVSYFPIGCYLGSSDRVHVIFGDDFSSLYHIAIKADGSLTTGTAVFVGRYASDSYFGAGLAARFERGGSTWIALPVDNFKNAHASGPSASRIQVLRWKSEDEPLFILESVGRNSERPQGSTSVARNGSSSCVYSNGTLYCIWAAQAVGADENLMQNCTRFQGWGEPVEKRAHAAGTQWYSVSAAAISAGLGMVIWDNAVAFPGNSAYYDSWPFGCDAPGATALNQII